MDKPPYYGVSSDTSGRVIFPQGDGVYLGPDGEIIRQVDSDTLVSSEGKIYKDDGGQWLGSDGSVHAPVGGSRSLALHKKPDNATPLKFVLGVGLITIFGLGAYHGLRWLFLGLARLLS